MSRPRARLVGGQTGFLLAAIGSATARATSGAFPRRLLLQRRRRLLIPYLVALIAGIPHASRPRGRSLFRRSPSWALRKIIGGGEFIGWFQTFVCLSSWSTTRGPFGAQYDLPVNAAWGDDPTTFFTDTFLQVVPGDMPPAPACGR